MPRLRTMRSRDWRRRRHLPLARERAPAMNGYQCDGCEKFISEPIDGPRYVVTTPTPMVLSGSRTTVATTCSLKCLAEAGQKLSDRHEMGLG